MENTRIQNKVKLLFDKISVKGYSMDNYYADSFINKLLNNSDPESMVVASMPILPELLADALVNMETYHTTVQVFLGRMLAVVCQTELNFVKIQSRTNDNLLECLNKINSPDTNCSLKVAYMELALALVTHKSGISWILETELWKNILGMTEWATVFISRLTYKFASNFMWKLNDLGDETTIILVLDFLWKPIDEMDLLNVVSYTVDLTESSKIDVALEPTIHILLSIVNRKEYFYEPNLVYKTFLQDPGIVTKVYILFEKIRNDDILLLLKKLLFHMVFLKIFQSKPLAPDVEYTVDDFMDLKVIFFNTLLNMLQRRKLTLVLDYCYMCTQIWATMCEDLELKILCEEIKTDLPNQFLFLSIVPLIMYIVRNAVNDPSKACERVNEYVFLVLNKASEHTARLGYMFRDLITEMGILPEMITQSVKRLTSLEKNLNNYQANILFQALFFVLKSYAPMDDDSNLDEEDIEEYQKKVVIMTYVIETLHSLVKNYNINWQDSLEVICLNTLIHYILTKKKNLTCKFVVASLSLMTVTVQKFLPPNLSLLMESKPGTAMHEIGSLIYAKMHDVHWEIRDSALELLHVCTEIAYVKFPPIQKQISENNLMNVALTIANNDYEPYVQVSAFRCVGAAVKVLPLWEQLKRENVNLLDELVMVLRNNQEGMVRKEVCSVLCEIYQHDKLTPAYKQTLYDHMASTAMSDFHWEVQLTSLKFWKMVIQSFLTEQGMLDGVFPPMTFSKASRKIVSLTNKEIQKRLVTVLDELASVGCLTVLLKLVHDDNEVDVMDAALNVAVELFTILQKYKVSEIVTPQEDEPKSIDDLLSDIKEDLLEDDGNVQEMEADTLSRAENVIEGILNEGDINLLADLYKKHLNLQNNVSMTNKTPKIKLLRTATPYLYVTSMSTNDYKSAIKEKREWKDGVRSLSSLLDDVLCLYDFNDETNSLDCY